MPGRAISCQIPWTSLRSCSSSGCRSETTRTRGKVVSSGADTSIMHRFREYRMSDSIVQRDRRGLLLMAAAAGVTLATPRLIRAAAGKADAQFGGDLSAVRAAIDKQRPE